MASAFQELREEWAELSREYARIAAAPYDPVAVAAHLENLRRHRARLHFLRTALRNQREDRAIH
jgi:hypothetical protein